MTRGKSPKPKHDPLVLLGMRSTLSGVPTVRDRATGRMVADPKALAERLSGIPGVNVIRRQVPKTPNVRSDKEI